MKAPAKADIVTPEELLESAERLFATGSGEFTRATVLEAMTALEVFVGRLIDNALDAPIGPDLAKYLMQKTKWDFDARVSLLAPIATGLPNPKTNKLLWQHYEEARKIRTGVVHAGQQPSADQAESVLRSVYQVMAYFAITAQVRKALIEFAEYIKKRRRPVQDGREAEKALAEYFSGLDAVEEINQEFEVGMERRADLVLRIGEHRVLIEAKFVHSQVQWTRRLREARWQAIELAKHTDVIGIGIVLFLQEQLPPGLVHRIQSETVPMPEGPDRFLYTVIIEVPEERAQAKPED